MNKKIVNTLYYYKTAYGHSDLNYTKTGIFNEFKGYLKALLDLDIITLEKFDEYIELFLYAERKVELFEDN